MIKESYYYYYLVGKTLIKFAIVIALKCALLASQ